MTVKTALTSILLLLIVNSVNAECINDIKTEEDLVLSNICTYTHTALVRIESVSMKDKYNPIAYLKDHRTYILKANVLETFKGDLPKQMCLTQWREGDFDTVQDMEGKQYVVSINKQNKCSVVDTGGIVESSIELIGVAKKYNRLHVGTDSSFIIEPATRVGNITKTSTEADLINAYGKENIKRNQIYIGEGFEVEGTILFPGTDKELTIEWKNDFREPQRITITHSNTKWVIDSGVTIGTTLDQLEEINKDGFKLTGFEWDYPGRTVSWKQGVLPIQLQLDLDSDVDIPFEEQRMIVGDRYFNSNNKIIKKMVLKVVSIYIRWDI